MAGKRLRVESASQANEQSGSSTGPVEGGQLDVVAGADERAGDDVCSGRWSSRLNDAVAREDSHPLQLQYL